MTAFAAGAVETFSSGDRVRDGFGRYVRFAGFILLMVLPVVAPFFVAQRLYIDREIDGAMRLEERLEREISRRLFAGATRERLARCFQRLYDATEKANFESGKPGGISSFAFPWIPVEFEAQTAIFRSDDTLWTPPGKTLDSRYVLTRFWKDLGRGACTASDERLYKSLFGNRFIFKRFLENPGVPVSIVPGNLDGYVVWRRRPAGGGLLVFLSRLPDPFLNLVGSISHSRYKGVWVVVDPGKRHIWSRGGNRHIWRDIIEEARLRGGGSFLALGFLCRLVRQSDGLWLMHGRSVERLSTKIPRDRLAVFSLLALIFLSVVWLKTGWTPVAGQRLTPSIIIFFILAVLVPGGLMIGLGDASLRERAKVLEEEVHTADVARLRFVDRLYGQRCEELVTFYRRIRDLPAMRLTDEPRASGIACELNRKGLVTHLETRTFDNTLVASHKGDPRLCNFVAFFSDEIMHRYLGKKVAPPSTPIGSLLRDMMGSPRLGFVSILEQPDVPIPLYIGTEDNNWYWDVRTPTASESIAYFMIAQSEPWNKDRFLEKSILPGVFVYDISRRRWCPGVPHFPDADGLVAEALMGRHTARGAVSLAGGRRLLLTAYPGTSLGGVCYITASDASPVQQEMEMTRRLYRFVWLLALGLALLAARIVSGALLLPISSITAGIEALDRGDLEHHVPDLGRDEFGRLAAAFNELMDERRQIDLGREVQRRILPACLPDVIGYELAYRCISMTELGGDYCDALPLPDGRLLLVICDVTGHGISAALLTTMAKTVVATGAQRSWDLASLLDRLNAMVNQVVQKKKLMTTAVILLNPTTHEFEWSCAGHPAPCLRRADGTVENLHNPQFPIGTRKKVIWKISVSRLEPGDSLVLYTDGIIEAMNEANEMFTYERFRDTVGECATGAPEATIESLLAINAEHIGTVPANDDLTLLVLRRLPLQKSLLQADGGCLNNGMLRC
ncbi:MAG: PP2C family protein-serine/threonine phosphatase [Candidatus Riflebacteria bacterium]|nr:PP2C family protein-serine/threonine phosphatase [Candidatus Riflebacteria bacterium]